MRRPTRVFDNVREVIVDFFDLTSAHRTLEPRSANGRSTFRQFDFTDAESETQVEWSCRIDVRRW